MTFNWPDIPFSGTEVDAFVVEYKALAEAIYEDYNDYNVNLNTVKLPFKHKEDVRIFLEYGLVYAAFIVKQRAGNNGPGGDFELGNSPLGLILPSIAWDRIFRDTGSNASESAIKECFENNQNGNKPNGQPCDPDSGEPLSPLDWYVREVGEGIKDLTTDDCQPFINNLNNTNTKTQEREGDCISVLLSTFFSLFSNVFTGGRITYLTKLTFKLVERYLKGVGGKYTIATLNSDVNPAASIWIREDIKNYLNTQLPDVVPLTPTEKTNYGMSQSGNAYVFDGTNSPGLKNALGSFTVITDGTEETIELGSGSGNYFLKKGGITSINQIKQVRDDYGFNDYGYTNERSRTLGDMPGDDLPDDQIKSGTEFPNSNTTPCQAAAYTELRRDRNNPNPKWNYLDIAAYIRYVVASNHGVGRVDPNGYINAPCVGKPFPIHFDWR